MATVSDYLVERLHAWGVRRVYGYPGDGINGVMGALERATEKIEFVQTRHEELAAFMACAHAKFTGEVGVCMATSGPGAIHLLNGLYDAKKDNMPVVAIVGQQPRTAMGADYQQEVDLISLFKDVAHQFVHSAMVPPQIRHLVDQALRIAISDRDVTCIILPADVQEKSYEEPAREHGRTFSGIGYRRPNIVPRADDLRQAADILNAGKKVAMLIGAGACRAQPEVLEAAERLGAGVAKALLAKDILDDRLPFVTGSIGLLGTRPSWDLMMNCDTLLMVGTSFPYSEFLPKEGQARAVQIDVKARKLALRYPVDVPLHGDAAATLQELIPLLEHKTDRAWRQEIEEGVDEWWRVLEARAMHDADPINPQRVFWELSPRLPHDCIITCDSGSAANWFARDLKVYPPMKASLSGGLATMCPGMPYALAGKMAYPDRAVIALVGDGAMQMLGNNALVTVASRWKQWADPRLIVGVLNNRDLNQVTWEQRVMSGFPKFEESQSLPSFSYARYAEMLGLKGIVIDDPDDVGKAWDTALAADRPVVLDFITDPEVPPLPPHITMEQATGYLKSMLRGEPNLGPMLKQSFKQMMASWLPGSDR